MRLTVLILVLICFLTQAGQDKDKPWKVDVDKVKIKLKKQFKKRNSNVHWTLEEYKDLNSFLEFREVETLLSNTLDKTNDFSELEEYGVKSKGQGRFTINFNEHPRWITIDDIFTSYHKPDHTMRGYYKKSLMKLGFKEDDFDLLISFIDSRDARAESEEAQRVITASYASRIRDNYNAGIDNTKLLYQWNNESILAGQRAYRDWAVDLLNQFDKQRQRILISEALDYDTKASIQVTAPFEEFVPSLEAMFVNENSIYYHY